MDEIWVPIVEPGRSDRYEISDQGRVRSLKGAYGRPRIAILAIQKGSTDRPKGRPKGRPQISLYGQDPVLKTYRIAVLVAHAFLGPVPDGLEICHNDGDDWNCRASNLRYDTHAENILDTVRHGTHGHTRRKTCKFGHPLDGVRKNGKTTCRYCLTCSRNRVRAYTERQKAAA